MKTSTGNTVRFPIASFGSRVASYDAAVASVGFTLSQEPVSRLSTGARIPGEFGLFRSDTGGCVGIHSENFGFLQPSESLKTLERARNIVGGEWSAVAVTKGGRQLAAFLNIEAKITAPSRGDKVGLSIALFDRFDGGGKCRLQLLANVLACNNGMTRSESLLTFGEKHNGELAPRFAAMEMKLLVNLQSEVEQMQNVVTKLDTTAMTREEVEGFARALSPAADENDVSARTRNTRDAIVTGFFRGTGNAGRTRWDAFNAVTEHLDWAGTFRETEFSREENRLESIVTGSAAKVRARAMELLLN